LLKKRTCNQQSSWIPEYCDEGSSFCEVFGEMKSRNEGASDVLPHRDFPALIAHSKATPAVGLAVFEAG
jgi:hypothetical protein